MKRYSDEFRRQAVAAIALGERITDAAKRLRIHRSVLDAWVKKFNDASPRSETKEMQTEEKRLQAVTHAAPPAESTMRGKITAEQKAAMVARLNAGGAGNSAKQIGKDFGVSDASVYLYRKAAMNGGVSPYLKTSKGKGAARSLSQSVPVTTSTRERRVVASEPQALPDLRADPRLRCSMIWLAQFEAEVLRQWSGGQIRRPDKYQNLVMLAHSELLEAQKS